MRAGGSISVWRWPLVLGAATLLGLGAALLGEGGVWRVLSWLALATPLAVIVLCVARSVRR